MPIVPHYVCVEPSPETLVCRFLQFWKFRDLRANEELHFTRVDLLKGDDPWEALPSDDFVRRALGLRRFDPNDEVTLNHDQAFNRQYSESAYIIYWQLFEGETLHMWERYARPRPRDLKDVKKGTETGVVLITTFERLKAQIASFRDKILVGLVRYGEAETKRYNLIEFLFTKQACFEREKELRILLECHDPMAGMNRHFNADNFPNREPLDENPLHPWIHPYKRRPIDLKSLVTEIRVSPWAGQEEMEDAELWVNNKNLGCSVRASDLTARSRHALTTFTDILSRILYTA